MTRFSRVLKLDFFEGRKAMMWGALCMVLLYLFFFWFAHNIGYHITTPLPFIPRECAILCLLSASNTSGAP